MTSIIHNDGSDLQLLWATQQTVGFSSWVRLVASKFQTSGLQLEAAASLIGIRPSELEAVNQLAGLDEDILRLLDQSVPPKTTWFLFAIASHQQVADGLRALRQRPSDEAPSATVRRAMKMDDGETLRKRVAQLDAAVFFKLAAIAKDYNLLRPKDRAALFNFGRARNSGKPLSDKQSPWAMDLIQKLIHEGALNNSKVQDDGISQRLIEMFEI